MSEKEEKEETRSYLKRFSSWSSWYVRSLTIEPSHFMWAFGIAIVSGAQLNTNLQLEKVCKYEKGYNDTVCDNLYDYPDEQVEVQLRVNDFQEAGQWLAQGPAIAYSLFIGPISDHIGLKPLLLLPLLGQVIDSSLLIVNYLYNDVLPLEFFWLANCYSYLGGSSVYYLAYYSYGSAITDQEGRAARLGRFDGFEVTSLMIGLLLSPEVFDWIDYLGTYIMGLSFCVAAFLYVLFIVKEPPREKPERRISSRRKAEAEAKGEKAPLWARFQDFFYFTLVEPMYKTAEALLRPRPRNLRFLVWLQLALYGTYWFLVNEIAPLYLYQTLKFEDFDGTSSSRYTAYDKFTSAVGLFVVLPFLSERLHVHDALTITGIQFLYIAGNTVMAFSEELWQMYIGQTLLLMRMCQWGTARALLTKSIPQDEIGTIYTVIAFLAAVLPLASNPAFRELYDSTIETFPSAFLLLGAAIGVWTAAGNAIVYTQRKKLLVDRWGNQINEGTEGEETRRAEEKAREALEEKEEKEDRV